MLSNELTVPDGKRALGLIWVMAKGFRVERTISRDN